MIILHITSELEELLEKLYEVSRRVGLTMNLSKMKVMFNNPAVSDDGSGEIAIVKRESSVFIFRISRYTNNYTL